MFHTVCIRNLLVLRLVNGRITSLSEVSFSDTRCNGHHYDVGELSAVSKWRFRIVVAIM